MPSIFLRSSLTPEEIAALEQEFPHYKLVTFCQEPNDWRKVEIIYGNHLLEEELQSAERLRWIHCTSSDTEGLCVAEIQKRGNILITLSKGQNVPQMAEFVIGALLAFAKQFFNIPQNPQEFYQTSKETLWTLQDKILLQIGLGKVGSAIVKLANSLGMKSWGVRRQRTFHPYCQKTFSLSHLHSLLPAADVVILALPKRGRREVLFKKAEFELMKNDAILIAVGSGDSLDDVALAEVVGHKKFRGILLDIYDPNTHPQNSPLWQMPNVILTPSIATYPESKEHIAFRIFRRNLRLFVPGKIHEMKNRVLS